MTYRVLFALTLVSLIPLTAHAQSTSSEAPALRESLTVEIGDRFRDVRVRALDEPGAWDTWQHALCERRCTFLVPRGRVTIETDSTELGSQTLVVGSGGATVNLAAGHDPAPTHVQHGEPPSYLPAGLLMGVGGLSVVAGTLIEMYEFEKFAVDSYGCLVGTIFGLRCNASLDENAIRGGAVLAMGGVLTVLAGTVDMVVIHRERARRLDRVTFGASATRSSAMIGATVRF